MNLIEQLGGKTDGVVSDAELADADYVARHLAAGEQALFTFSASGTYFTRIASAGSSYGLRDCAKRHFQGVMGVFGEAAWFLVTGQNEGCSVAEISQQEAQKKFLSSF